MAAVEGPAERHLTPVVAADGVVSGVAGPRSSRLARRIEPWRGRFAHLFVGLVALNAADLVTTRLVLDRGGTEANPVLEPIIDDLARAACVKVLCLALVGVLLVRVRRTARVAAVLLAVTAWYAFVVLWNVRVLLTAG